VNSVESNSDFRGGAKAAGDMDIASSRSTRQRVEPTGDVPTGSCELHFLTTFNPLAPPNAKPARIYDLPMEMQILALTAPAKSLIFFLGSRCRT
jgi:hypothetical protein